MRCLLARTGARGCHPTNFVKLSRSEECAYLAKRSRHLRLLTAIRSSVTTDLSTEAMRARLQWWLAETRLTDVDPIRKRVQLVAANVIGQHSNQS